MKKLFSLILILVVLISTAACGREGGYSEKNSDKKVIIKVKENLKEDKEDKGTKAEGEQTNVDANDKAEKTSEAANVDKAKEQAKEQTTKDSTSKTQATNSTAITTSKDNKETKPSTGNDANSNQTTKPGTTTTTTTTKVNTTQATTNPVKKISDDPIMTIGKLEFSLQDIEGDSYNSLDIFKENKMTMINIWGTLCAPCIKELPELQALSMEFSSKGIGIIGIVGDVSGEDGLEDAKTIIGKKKVEYLNLIPNSEISEILISKINGYPVTIFVDGEGNLVGEPIVGARSKEEYKEIAEKVFGEM